jgi:sugar phosphate isomerase/epimerase
MVFGNAKTPHAMDESPVTRRDAIKKAALAGLFLPMVASGPALRAQPSFGTPRAATLKLGIVGYSLRTFPIDEAIRVLKELHVTSASVFRVHLPIGLSTPEVCRAMAQKFRDAGISIASTGVVYLKNSEGEMRHAFECGRAAGLTTMTASYASPPDPETFRLTERFVKEYDMRLAFHNHGPEDKIFPSPLDVWNAVQPYDERLGLCIDVGHSARAGVDPAGAILKCHARLYDVHLKDTLAGAGVTKDEPVGLGYGRLDLRGIMAALLQVGYPYQAGLEDEIASPDPVPGIAQSYGYMRGLLAALAPPPLPA